MADTPDRTWRFYRDANGGYRIKVDAPGERAVSAPVDPAELVAAIAKETGLTIRVGDNPTIG